MKLKSCVVLAMAASLLSVPALADKGKKNELLKSVVREESTKARDEVINDASDGDIDDEAYKAKVKKAKDKAHEAGDVDAGKEKLKKKAAGKAEEKLNGKNGGKALPPGLQKKLERGGELPPGWQNKVKAGEVLDPAIYAKGKVVKAADKHGNEIIQVEDKVLKVNQKTREVLDVIDAVKTVTDQ